MSDREVRVRRAIAAPPARVWELISDITVMPRFSTELQSVEWADGFDRPVIGAQFLGVNIHPAVGQWTSRSQIVILDPPRRFGWVVGDPETPSADWTFEVNPAPSGTELCFTARIGPGPSGVSMMIERQPHLATEIIAGRLGQFRKGMEDTLRGIGELAEGGSD
ncbi:SRPBCC family protein [Mycolicibacterium sp.]|uniref:SRPBCC family protein n=1 Tax=Mycolicibacterium sp. TaxID=2320850 RepID=UPI001D2B84CD|nr:SRPBCC family protein [Mycolicibacterium sp.]MCB1289984.1 SRPBCC family protein [Mycobacterium sp.]MCB9408096.1 SRPBCC family protein [Mycolicibacterium sp.]MCB9424188.1 SRPBCC family protein [Actinomycetota bacterium]